jgi:hypothetical protein
MLKVSWYVYVIQIFILIVVSLYLITHIFNNIRTNFYNHKDKEIDILNLNVIDITIMEKYVDDWHPVADLNSNRTSS